MKFEQVADFEIKQQDKTQVRINNDAPQAASIDLLGEEGEIDQEVLEEMYGDEALKLENTFTVEQFRDGEVIHSETVSNMVTNAAINDILDTYFGATAKKAGFFLGLIDATGFTAVALADTMAAHAGWTEFVTYTEAVRQGWTAAAAATQAITGVAVSEFTIGTVAAQSIQGLFVTDSNAKSGVVGFLWSTALFSSPAPVVTGDVFRVTYTLRLGN
ncbi:hypothetical protein KAU11_08110 [Candidatus Babeliales bacterium]|nr:hypothetical protein [Candidatus Babeliales bacterium]